VLSHWSFLWGSSRIQVLCSSGKKSRFIYLAVNSTWNIMEDETRFFLSQNMVIGEVFLVLSLDGPEEN
jgi:hypothetical protein